MTRKDFIDVDSGGLKIGWLTILGLCALLVTGGVKAGIALSDIEGGIHQATQAVGDLKTHITSLEGQQTAALDANTANDVERERRLRLVETATTRLADAVQSLQASVTDIKEALRQKGAIQ